MSASNSPLTLQESYILRGLAISAVVLVHVLAYLSGIYFQSPTQWFYVGLDQLSRFSVPLFIMVSGYGLAVKYSSAPMQWTEYLQARFSKLLPAYLLWSLFSVLIVQAVPVWSFGNQPTSWVIQLLFGQADYQLYFVVVLCQLYLIFPFLWLLRRQRWLILMATLGLQVIWVLWLAGYIPVETLSTISKSERFEYVVALSWIGYFGLGIWLQRVSLPDWVKKWSPWAMCACLVWVVFQSMTAINQGLDPLFALKFTRWPVILFAVLANITLFIWHNEVRRGLGKVGRGVGEWLGQNSFVIFLSHTIALRIIASALNQQLSWFTLVAVSSAWGVMVYVTRRWLIK